MGKFYFIFIALIIAIIEPSLAKEVSVCSSIRPLYGIVHAVAGNYAKTELIVDKPNVSPHNYQLSPSDLQKIENCQLIFLFSFDLEHFLSKPIRNLAKGAQIIELSNDSRIKRLAKRQHNIWLESEEDDEEPHHHHDSTYDPHIWLDPDNARIIANIVAEHISKLVPTASAQIHGNADEFINRIKLLDLMISDKLRPYQELPFIVFHDAYQYFEHKYNLHSVAAITINPEKSISPQGLQRIEQLINQNQVRCLFKEPQFPNNLLHFLAKKKITIGQLDAEWGSNPVTPIESNNNSYIQMMKNLVDNFVVCMKKKN